MVRKQRRSGKKTSRLALGATGARGATSKRGDSAPSRRGGALVVVILGALVLVNLYVFVWDKKTSVGAIKAQAEAAGPGAMPALSVGARPLEQFGSAAAAPVTLITTPTPAHAGSDASATHVQVAPGGHYDGKVARSDTLGRLLKKSGLSAAEADEIIRALAGVLDFKTIRAGQAFHLERGADGRVSVFELEIHKSQRVRAERDDAGHMIGKAALQ